MLFFAYDLDEYVDARDFYVPFETFVPGRIVRTFAELLDAIRRDDYEADKVARVRRPPFRPPRRWVDRPRHRPADPALGERPRPDHPDRAGPGRLRAVAAPAAPPPGGARHGPRRRARRQPGRHPRRPRGAPPGGPGGRPRPSPGARPARPARGRLAGDRRRATTWRPRGCSSSTTTSSRSTSSGRGRGPRSSRRGTPAGAFKKVGYSVLDKSFGMDEALASRVRIHSNYDVCLMPSRPPRRTTPRRSASRSTGSCRASGIPRTDVFFGEERLARPREAVRRPLRPAGGKRVILYAPTFRGDSVTDARATDDLDLDLLHDVARRRPRPARPAPPVHPVADDDRPRARRLRDRRVRPSRHQRADARQRRPRDRLLERDLRVRAARPADGLLRAGLRGVRARARLLLRLPDGRARADLRDDRQRWPSICAPGQFDLEPSSTGSGPPRSTSPTADRRARVTDELILPSMPGCDPEHSQDPGRAVPADQS